MNDVREAFEVWARENGWDLTRHSNVRDPGYLHAQAEDGWTAWRAATARAQRVPLTEVRLWDSQWVNIVNNPEVLSTDKEQAVSIAVKLTEKAIAKNHAENNWPPSAGITAQPSGGKGE